MSGTIFFIRHAQHAHVGHILSGRMLDLPLTDAGRQQAAALALRLTDVPFAAVQASPVRRAQETAAALGRPIATVAALDEVDFGDWTGRSFAALDADPDWQRWNAARGSARAPGGESMAEAQARVVDHVAALDAAAGGGDVALVTHCDIIRAALAHYLGLPLDHLLRFDVDPASVSRVRDGRVLSINETVH